MISYLKIKNYIIIKQLEIAFCEGFNVITGETGAGKSIILGALKLLLGMKANSELIKKGCDRADIQAVFQLDEGELKKINESLGLDLEEEIVISRELYPNRSVCKLNGDLITRAKLKEIGEFLIHIHGQNDNWDLINESAQREILDDFIFYEDRALLDEVKSLHKEYAALQKQRESGDFNLEEIQKQIDFLSFQMDEIDEIAVTDEDEEVEKEFERLKHSVDIGYMLQDIVQCLDYEDEGVLQSLRFISSKLSDVSKFYEVESDISLVDEFYYEIKDRLHQYRRMLDDLEEQSMDFESVEKRFDQINSLKRKYGQSVEEILAYRRDLDVKVQELSQKMELAENIDVEIEKKRAEYDRKASELHDLRVKHAKSLQAQIQEAMQDLNFDNAQFEIRITEKPMSEQGMDAVSFMVSLNAGMSLAPIKNVASGGEISRIMLAIQSVAQRSDSKPTIIFDEIDAGISGRSASAVAKRMHKVSRNNQVIAITHLAQVALYSDEHFLIDKRIIDGNSESNLIRLNEEERLTELARIMGGEYADEDMIRQARELREKVLKEL